jgi:hypothetical protein
MEKATKIKNTIEYFTDRNWVFSLRDLSLFFSLTEDFELTEEDIEPFIPSRYMTSNRLLKRLDVEKCYHQRNYKKKVSKYYIYDFIMTSKNKKPSVILGLLHDKINKSLRSA